MTRKQTAWLAWGLSGIISAGTILLYGLQIARYLQNQTTVRLVAELGYALFPVVVSLLAALIVSRQPRNLIGWLLMLPSATFLLSRLVSLYLERYSAAPPPVSPLLVAAVAFSNWGWVMLIFPLLIIPLIFPTGRTLSRRWDWVFGLAVGLWVVFIFAATFAEQLIALEGPDWGLRNPIGFIPNRVFVWFIVPWLAALAWVTVASVLALLVRYRRSGPVEREQIKWLLFACGLFAALYIPSLVVFNTDELTGLAGDLWELAFITSLLAIPASIAIAITRYRLWDIDVIIRRTLIYGVLTAALALVYTGSVIFLQQVFQAITGSQGRSQPAVVLSTLAVAALFIPLRRRVQDRIDRYFFRSRYTAERVLADFAVQARQQTDLTALTAQLEEVVQNSLQPEFVTFWLRKTGPKQENG